MSQISRLLTRPFTSETLDTKVGQIGCWLLSALVLVLGILKLCRLPVNETQLFFGVLSDLTNRST